MQEDYPHKVGDHFVFTRSLEPGDRCERHSHKGRVETCHILSGVGTFEVERTRIKKSVGESISFRKNISHTIQNHEDTLLEWLEVSVILDHRIDMATDSHMEEVDVN